MTDHLDTLDLAALAREAERLGYVRGVGQNMRTRAWWSDGAVAIVWAGAGGWTNGTTWGGADEAAALRWLLRQPEAVARAACYDRGVAEERARAVAWLRAAGDEAERAAASMIGDRMASGWYTAQANRLRRNADALERGEHEVTRG